MKDGRSSKAIGIGAVIWSEEILVAWPKKHEIKTNTSASSKLAFALSAVLPARNGEFPGKNESGRSGDY